MLKLFLLSILFGISFQIISAENKCLNVESNGLKLLCYVESTTVKEIDICSCTHVILNNKVANKEYAQNLKTINSKLKLLRELDISNAVTNISEEIFDGLLLKIKDKQYAELKSNLTSIVQGLKSNNILFMELPPFAQHLAKYYDLKGLSKYIDLFILRTDSLNGREGTVYHPSRLSGLWDMLNADSLIDLVTGLGTEESKLAISTSMNVLKFTLKNKTQTLPGSLTSLDNNKPETISQNDLCNLLNSTGNWTIERDEDQAGPYAFSEDKWVAFEDSLSLQIKAKYIRIRKLAGLAIYGIENDSACDKEFPLLTITSKALFTQSRVPRGALLHSLERDIMSNEISRFIDVVSVSPYRITRVIDEEGHVHAIREDMKTHFSCSRQGYFVHPKSCGRFYRCVKFNQLGDEWSVFEFSCPTGLVFDSRWEVCVWPGSSPHACPGSSEITPVPRERFVCPSVEGYYADPENCRWFFACLDHGKAPFSAYEFRCPFGLVFDESRILCDWPWKVKGHCGSVGIVEGETYYSGSEKLSISGQLHQNGIGVYSEANGENYLTGQEVHFENIGISPETVQKTYSGHINNNEGIVLENIKQLSPVGTHANEQAEYYGGIGSEKSGIALNINSQGQLNSNYKLLPFDGSAIKTSGVAFSERNYQPIISTEKPYFEETLLLNNEGNKDAGHLLSIGGNLAGTQESVSDNYKIINNLNVHPTERSNIVSFGLSEKHHQDNKNILLAPLITSNSDSGIIGHRNIDNAGILTSVSGQQVISTPAPLHIIGKESTGSNFEFNSNLKPNLDNFAFVSSTPNTLQHGDVLSYGNQELQLGYNKKALNNGQVLLNQENIATIIHGTETVHNPPVQVSPVEQNIKLTYSEPKSVLVDDKLLSNSESILNTYNTKNIDHLALNIQSEPKLFSAFNENTEFIQHSGKYQKTIPNIKYETHVPVINEQNDFVQTNDNTPNIHYVENSAFNFGKKHEPKIDLVHSQIHTPIVHATSQFFGNRKSNLVPVQFDNNHNLYLGGLQGNENYNSTYHIHTKGQNLINKNVYNPILISTPKPFTNFDTILSPQINSENEFVENINFEYRKPNIKISPITVSTPQTYIESELNGNVNLEHKQSNIQISPVGFSTISPVQKTFESFSIHSTPRTVESHSNGNINLHYKQPDIHISPVGFSTISPVQKTFESFRVHSTPRTVESYSNGNINLHYKEPDIHISPVGFSTISPVQKTFESFSVHSTPRTVESQSNGNINLHYKQPDIHISPAEFSTISPVQKTFESFSVHSTPRTVESQSNENINLNYNQPDIHISPIRLPTVSTHQKTFESFNVVSTPRTVDSGLIKNVNFEYREPNIKISPVGFSTVSPLQETFENVDRFSVPQTVDSVFSKNVEYKKPDIQISPVGFSTISPVHKTFETFNVHSTPGNIDSESIGNINLNYKQPDIHISPVGLSTISPPRKTFESFNIVSTPRTIDSGLVENVNFEYRQPNIHISPVEFSTVSPVHKTFENVGTISTPQTYVENESFENVNFEYRNPKIRISQHGHSGNIYKQNSIDSTTHPVIIQENIQPVNKLLIKTEPSATYFENIAPQIDISNQPGHSVHFSQSERPLIVSSEYSQSTTAPIIQNIKSFENGYSSTLKPEFNFVTEKPYSHINTPDFTNENLNFDIKKNNEYTGINNYKLNVHGNDDAYLRELDFASQFDSKKKIVDVNTSPVQQIIPSVQTYNEKYESVSPFTIDENSEDLRQSFVSSTRAPIKYVTERVIPFTSSVGTSSEILKYHNGYKVLPTKSVKIGLLNNSFKNRTYEIPVFTDSLETKYSSPSTIIDDDDSIELTENQKQDYVPEYEGIVYKHPVQHINKNRIITLPETEHPYLITKLGATCHCVSNNLKLRQKSAGAKRPAHLFKTNGNRGSAGIRNTSPKQIFLESVTPTILTPEIESYSIDNKYVENFSSTSTPIQSSDLIKQVNWGPGFVEKITPSEYFIKNIQLESQGSDGTISSSTPKTLNYEPDSNIHYVSSTPVPFETESLRPQKHFKTVTEISQLVDSSPAIIDIRKIDIPKTVVIKPVISSTPISIKALPTITTPVPFVTKTIPITPQEEYDTVEIRTSEPKFSIPVEVADRKGSIGISLPFDRYGFGGRRTNDETLQGTLDCTRPGLFRHPHHCDKFYSCRWDCDTQRFTLHVFNCPVRLSFDESQGACNWPQNGPACQHDTLIFSRK